MTDPTGDGDNGRATRKPRRWLKYAAVTALAVVVVCAGVWAGFRVWLATHTPEDGPRIAISLADTWLNESGILRSTYDQAMARAGARLITFEPGDAPPEPEAVRRLLVERRIDGVLHLDRNLFSP